MSIFAVVKQYHQSASAHSDMIIKDDASSHKEAVECAFNYLIENDNRANELGDYELKTILFNENGFDTGDYSVVIYCSDDFLSGDESDEDIKEMAFELELESASDTSIRQVAFQ
jgi:hypothetical protein